MKTPFIFAIAGLGLLSACGDSGANYTPILDGAPKLTFEADLAACQSLAQNQKQFDQETAAATAMGAAAGAALGEADSGDAWGGAIAGALIGGISVAEEKNEQKQEIVIACMRGRGHAIVG